MAAESIAHLQPSHLQPSHLQPSPIQATEPRAAGLRRLLTLLRLLLALAAGAARRTRHRLGARLARRVPCIAAVTRPVSRRPRECPGTVITLRPPRLRAVTDAGMTTAEYAVGTVAACGFAAILYKVVTSDAVSNAITGLIQRALNAGF